MNRRSLFLVVAVLLALMLAYAATPTSRIVVHFLVAQVCHGVSAGKIFFCLIFLMVFCLRTALLAPAHQLLRRRGITLAASLTIGLAAGLVSHLLYTAAHALPLNWHAFHWKDGFNSVTCTTHIHTSKACIALFLQAVGLEQWCAHFDTGVVFAHDVPGWLALTIGAAFALSLFLALHVGPHCVARYPRGEQTAVTVVLGLGLAALCKCVLDGGPLAYDAVAGALAVALIAKSTSLAALARGLRHHALRIGMVVGLWLTVVAAIDLTFLEHQAQQFLYRTAIYGCILATGYCSAHRNPIRTRPAACAAGTAAIACWFSISAAARQLWPLWQPAPARILTYQWLDQPHRYEGNLEFVRATDIPVHPGHRYWQAYQTAGNNPLRVRNVSAAPRDPSTTATGLYADLIILAADTEALTFLPSDILTIERMDPVNENGALRWRIEVRLDGVYGPVLWRGPSDPRTQIDENERFVAYALLDHYLRACGVREYILIPLAQYAQHAPASAQPGGYGPV
jgi:hypothetical protein